MLLCGCPDAVRDLLPHLRQTLVMESSIPTWSELGKGLKGPDSWSEGDGEAFWPFAPSFLLARAWTGKRPIADLLPEEIHEQRNFPRQVAMALVVMGLLLPLLWGVTRMLSRQKTQRERDLAQMEQMVATVRDQSQRLEERRRVRRDLLERRLTLNRPIKQVDLATRWILGLTHEVGAGIRLTQVRLEERFDPSGGWDVKVEGRVVDETFAQASQRISTLVARVREAHPQGGWVLTRSTVVDPIPSETGRDSRLGFTLTGHLEGGER